MENEFFEEYHKVMEKDKLSGKDFNRAAYDEAKKAKYYFEYMRTQEKMYNYLKEKDPSISQQ